MNKLLTFKNRLYIMNMKIKFVMIGENNYANA